MTHDPSSLSFHIDQTGIVPNVSPTIPFMPTDLNTIIALYISSYLLQLIIAYYAIHKFIESGNSIIDATLIMTTLRALFMAIFVLGYMK